MGKAEQSELLSGEPESSNTSFVDPSSDEKEFKRWHFKSLEGDLVRALIILSLPILFFDLIFRAAARAFWFDEILTILVARQASISGIWTLLSNGVTTHPPVMYIVEHWLGKVGGNERIVLRLPSIVAFLSILACLFVFIKRRTGPLIALVSSAAILLTLAFDFYAFEARPYELMVLCIAVALVSYDRVDSVAGITLFWLSLAMASSVNFYAGFAFLPFGLAELAYLISERKLRLKIWLGFLAGALPYIFFWPLLRKQEVLFGAHNWASPTLEKLANSYGEVLHLPAIPSCAIFAAAMAYLLYLAFSGNSDSQPEGAARIEFRSSDLALAIGFLAIPAATYGVTLLGHGAITGRYVIATTLGIPLALGVFLSRLRTPAVVTVGFLIFLAFLGQEAAMASAFLFPLDRKYSVQPPMEVASKMGIPVVVSNGLLFLPIWYAGNDQVKSQLYFLDEPEEQYRATGSDTWTLLLRMLPDYIPIHVQKFSEFGGSHRKFLIYSSGDADDYWPGLLVSKGYKIRTIYIGPPTSMGSQIGINNTKTILYLVDLDDHN